MPSKSMIPSEPRYSRTKKIALDFIIEEGLCGLPIDPFKIAFSHGWKIEAAGDIAKDLKCSHEYLLHKYVKSKDGAAFYCKETNEYNIVFNEKVRSTGRIRWTLAHEIGHIVLGHLNDYNQSTISRGLTENAYDILEKEAHYFAGQVLAPPVILHKLKINSVSKLKNICKLSDEAASIRYNHLIEWIHKGKILPVERDIISQFYSFIYKRKCNHCGHGFVSKVSKYCPICGFKLTWGDGEMKYTDGVSLDGEGRAYICPRCDNEDIDEGNYCKICGAYVINRCTNDDTSYDGCGVTASGNARFCVQCGAETTFYRDDLLDSWEKVYEEMKSREVDQEIQEEAAAAKGVLDKEFKPNDEDDDLPF
jgi:rubrerythrin